MSPTTEEINWLETIENLFRRFGIKSITMDDVAAELGISKKTLYQMVDSKDDLVHRVVSHHITREKSQCLHMASSARNAIDEIFIVIDSNSQEMAQMKTNIINDLQKYHRDSLKLVMDFHYDFVLKIIRENMQRGREEGLYREDFDIDIVSKLHLASAFTIFDEQVFPESSTSRVDLFKELMMHFLHGIVSPKGLTYLKKKIH